MEKAELVRQKAWRVWNLGQSEPEYQLMFCEMKEIEDKYQKVLQGLPTEQQDIICDFVSQCEGMSCRMLEIACMLMEFPDEA